MKKDWSFKIRYYKCFREEAQGFDEIRPVNLIIGRNNSGKSSLLDLVENVLAGSAPGRYGTEQHAPEVLVTHRLTEAELKSVFKPESGGGALSGNHWAYGQRFIGKAITWSIASKPAERRVVAVGGKPLEQVQDMWRQVVSRSQTPMSGFQFVRLSGDRDVLPERPNAEPKLSPNGGGTTAMIQLYQSRIDLPDDMVERRLLDDLNSILAPDARFDRVVAKEIGSGTWEVFLDERLKGRIALSRSGNGLKTILIVLVLARLLPHFQSRSGGQKSYVFGFEELENNLHPALLRRFLTFLRQVAVDNDWPLFLTTHSSVAIDLFSRDEAAQIIHVTHDGACAVARPVLTYSDHGRILDDLGVRASDILQANCVVWVEGPSDRTCFNRWIELKTHGDLKEGVHYQCVFYGGRLLAHISCAEPKDSSALVAILSVNRNAIVLMDSDKDSPDDELNATKTRVMEEVSRHGGMCWVTAGREIENYHSQKTLERVHGVAAAPVGQFEAFGSYLEAIDPEEASKFVRSKAAYAERVCRAMVLDDLCDVLDLNQRVDEAVRLIQKFNAIG